MGKNPAETWSLRQLVAEAALPVRDAEVASADVPVRSLTVDSRAVAPGSCFVAVRGAECDGHVFVPDAIRAGATAVVVDREVDVPPGVARLCVPDTKEAIARLSAAFYRIGRVQHGRRLRLIGITGTNGKSTTARLLQSILQAAGHPTALLGTLEYDLVEATLSALLTTPAPVELCRHLARAASAGATYAVMEVSSHGLAQRRCDGLTFEVAVFTNLSGDHLDYHVTKEEYLAAKKRLFDGLNDDAFAVVNGQDPAAAAMVQGCRARVVRYGLENGDFDIYGAVVTSGWQGSRFGIGESMVRLGPVTTPLLGRHNVLNALAAAGAAAALGVRADAIRRGIESVRSVRGRLEPVEPGGCPFRVVVDYAHSDGALETALRALRPLTRGRLICVFGCGGDRDRTKRPRMGRVVEKRADVAFVTSDNPRSEEPLSIIEQVLPGFGSRPQCVVRVVVDRAKAIRRAIESAGPGDTVLIAGKGHEDYQVVGDKRLPFDDAKIASACLKDIERAAKVTDAATACLPAGRGAAR